MNSINLITKSALMSASRVVEPLWWVGHIPFVMWLIENTKPQTLVELGTHTGNSYFSMCQSVKKNALPTRCYAIDTWQGDLHQGSYEDDVYQSVKQYNDSHYSEFSDLLRMTFDEALPKFSEGTVDLLHIDGLHTYEAVRHDFETWLPKLSDRAVVLFHDTSVRKLDFGVWRLWEELSVKYPHIHFDYSQGLGVLFVGEKQPSVINDVISYWATPEGRGLMHQLFARLGQSVEFEYATANPEQAIVKRDEHIASIYQLLTGRDGQIDSLNQAMAEREKQIASLGRDLVENKENFLTAQQLLYEQQHISNELRNEIDSYRTSNSWRITKPLRQVSKWLMRGFRLIFLYKNYRQRFPGIKGLLRLTKRCIGVIRKDGVNGLYANIALYERVVPTKLALPLKSAFVLNDISDEDVELPKDVAVHAHIYYVDLATEIQLYLANIPVKIYLYVTTDTFEKAKIIEDCFLKMENILKFDIRVTENRGRDILPMLVELGAKLAQHEIVLHIHTKKSPHNTWELGGWRRHLMESLLGNPQRVTAILRQFLQNKNLGILFPDPFHPVKKLLNITPHVNDGNILKLLRLAGKRKGELDKIDKTFFPAGDMFWFRGKAIQPFVDMKLSNLDFEPELGQVNITMAHAIERMFPYFAGEAGLSVKSYISDSILSPECSAHQIELLHAYIGRGLVSKPAIIFDHNGGGGANIYTQQLVKTIHADHGSVLRIYCFEAVFFVQWICDGDGMLFYTSSIDEVFEKLAALQSDNIILNSLYGFTDVALTISKITKLAKTLDAKLDVKVHDFYAACPSPHLLNFEGKYCGVPQDQDKCSHCLVKNHGWFHSWYPEKNKPAHITEWRQSFMELFGIADSISFFDQSSVKILSQAFDLDLSKVKVTPHNINYFKCDKKMDVAGPLHIGILGTLSIGKGGNVVNAISKHIQQNNLGIPITVVGRSVVALPEEVFVWGDYTPNDLPEILSYRGINVILMASVVPETFSYTISEAMEMGLPIVAFDIGAQGARIKNYEFGKVIPLNSTPDIIIAAIKMAQSAAQKVKI